MAASIRNMRVGVLEEMDRLKTQFFANISHEFRTPITLTLGPLEQVLNGRYGPIGPEVAEQLGTMRRNQERLLALVNQILDLAKLEAREMRPDGQTEAAWVAVARTSVSGPSRGNGPALWLRRRMCHEIQNRWCKVDAVPRAASDLAQDACRYEFTGASSSSLGTALGPWWRSSTPSLC